MFLQEKSSKSIWIFALKWKFKQIDLNLCFDKVDLNFVSWQVKSNRFICIFVLTGKIQNIDLNFCSDVHFLILVPKTAWKVDGTKRGVETESARALMHSALSIKGDRKISCWILKNITFPFTTTNLQYNCGMKSTVLPPYWKGFLVNKGGSYLNIQIP